MKAIKCFIFLEYRSKVIVNLNGILLEVNYVNGHSNNSFTLYMNVIEISEKRDKLLKC